MKTVMKPIVVLLGAAGSGKGTQAALLVERYGFVKVDAGDLIRQRAKEDSPLGRELKRINESGGHTPDDMVGGLMREYMAGLAPEKPLVVDGFPRTVGQDDILRDIIQAIGFDGRPYHVVWIKVDLEEAKRRLLQRSVCQSCRTIFASRDLTVCPVCGGEVKPRVDDQVQAIEKRLQFFNEGPMKVVERYRQRGHIHEINGDQTVEQVHADLLKAIEY